MQRLITNHLLCCQAPDIYVAHSCTNDASTAFVNCKQFCSPVDLKLLQLFSNLKDEVEALVGLVCGEGQHLVIHTMVLHVLQHSRGSC